ncbi:hypothetical protein SBA5_390014 [Candidatus Sulfotelmatomonas gaucii]|uniref:Uncharacterized protein n=1 Tax=Candidatus Sulfuritelmatomonas gaucii TaxID=2043161 RepID=A0A2N9LJE7_9BACT|nr:hypothetical protein SBA5_390014 [Candidatus Sulfotelmatomonas gaucii]
MSLHFFFEVLQLKLGYDFAFEEMNFAFSVAGEAGTGGDHADGRAKSIDQGISNCSAK